MKPISHFREDGHMAAKEYLNQVRLLDRQISAKLEQIARLRSLTEKITVSLSPTAGTGSPNPTALQDRIIRLVEAEEELNAEIDRLVDLKQEISEVLKLVQNDLSRIVLEERYLNGRTWGEIIGIMGYHERTVFKFHDQGLREINTVMKTDEFRRIHEKGSKWQ